MLFILLAVGIALVGTWLVGQFMSQKEGQFAQRMRELEEKSRVDQADVVFTKVDIAAQVALTKEMMEVRKMPRNLVPADAVTSLDGVEGRFSRVPMVAEEPLRSTKMANRDTVTGLPYRIPAGKRAVTILMSEQKAVAFAINPGNRVDVMGIFAPDEAEKQLGPRCVTILQDIEVLDITFGNQEDAQNPRTGTPSATLLLDPRQAEIIALVESRAQIVLSLRAVNDNKAVASQGVNLAEVVNERQAPPTDEPAPNLPVIEIYSGSQKQSITVPK